MDYFTKVRMSLRQRIKPYTKFLLITLSGYIFVLVGLLVLALQLSDEIDDFTSQTNQLYRHPFQVNGAARTARQSVSSLRTQLLYAVIDQTNIKREAFAGETNTNQVALTESLKVIQTNFLGDMEKVKEAKALASQLRDTRSAIIELLLNGHIVEAEKQIRTQATPQYNALLNRMDYIVEFSSNKAVNIVKQARERGEESLTKLWILISIFAVFTLLSGGITLTIVLRNLHKRDLTLQEANESLRVAATAFETQEGMMVTNADKSILRVNRAFSKITGYTPEEVIGRKPNVLSSGEHKASFYSEMWYEIKQSGYWEGEVWNQRKNREVYPQKLTITAVRNTEDVVTNYVGTLNDITRNKQAEKEIADLAYFDPLTRLPNRRLLIDRLHHALVTHNRNDYKGALLFLDLDHFKTLNDTLGHDMGDQLLKQVAERLVLCLRESDTVSRFGGDEFVILIESLSKSSEQAATQVEDVATKILNYLYAPYSLAGHNYRASTSIGITLFHGDTIGVEELLKQADIALYQAKDDGRNSMRFFDPQMQEKITRKAELETELNQAIELEQFELYYQIQMNNSHTPLGAEALIRWNHPTRGVISPAEFIPLAEQNGSIVLIGQWVLNKACEQLQLWQNNSKTKALSLSINVSVKQFHQEDFVETVQTALAFYKVQAQQLKLELTESMLLNDIDGTIAKMLELSKLGIQFSLDDFGTGYSSLQYLKKLPLYQLKIDKSFIDGLANNSYDQEIVRTIIAMSHSLGLSVIAEGVENEQQLLCLLDEGCLHYQGYFFGKPEKITAYETRINQIESDPA